MLNLDQELLDAVLAAAPGGPARTPFARGDWQGIRAYSEAALAHNEATLPEHAEVERRDVFVPSYDEEPVLCRWYEPPGSTTSPGRAAVCYLHGGGLIAGSVELYDRVVAGYVAATGTPFLSVDYRLAPEHRHPTPAEDAFAGLGWLCQQASALGVDAGRLAVMGDSAGGGLAAVTALLARDRGLPLAKQILVYPMLDDRTTEPDPHIAPFAAWSYDDNFTGWQALLGEAVGGAEVPAAAAPARATDLGGVAPAYLEVGELDIFRDETIQYARGLAAAGVSAELHVHPGCPHGFDRVSPTVGVVSRARQERLRVIAAL